MPRDRRHRQGGAWIGDPRPIASRIAPATRVPGCHPGDPPPRLTRTAGSPSVACHRQGSAHPVQPRASPEVALFSRNSQPPSCTHHSPSGTAASNGPQQFHYITSASHSAAHSPPPDGMENASANDGTQGYSGGNGPQHECGNVSQEKDPQEAIFHITRASRKRLGSPSDPRGDAGQLHILRNPLPGMSRSQKYISEPTRPPLRQLYQRQPPGKTQEGFVADPGQANGASNRPYRTHPSSPLTFRMFRLQVSAQLDLSHFTNATTKV